MTPFYGQVAALSGEYEAIFKRDAQAWAFFSSQPAGYRRLASWKVLSAKKEETRLARLEKIIEASRECWHTHTAGSFHCMYTPTQNWWLPPFLRLTVSSTTSILCRFGKAHHGVAKPGWLVWWSPLGAAAFCRRLAFFVPCGRRTGQAA
jgi:hypothetical protein